MVEVKKIFSKDIEAVEKLLVLINIEETKARKNLNFGQE